jgi:hypothetical protein
MIGRVLICRIIRKTHPNSLKGKNTIAWGGAPGTVNPIKLALKGRNNYGEIYFTPSGLEE